MLFCPEPSTRLSRACNGIRDSNHPRSWYVLETRLSPRSWHLPRAPLEGLVASSLPILRCRQFQGLPSPLRVFLLSRGLVSCLLGKVTDILSSSGLALSRVEGLCVWKRGDVEQRFIVGSCSLLPCSFSGFTSRSTLKERSAGLTLGGGSPAGTINGMEEFSYTNRKSDLRPPFMCSREGKL